MDRKTDEFWFLCEPILARAAWRTESRERSAKKRRKRCTRKMDKTVLSQSPCSTAGVSQLPCLEAEATAPTTIPNGAHSATTEPAHCTPEMGGSSKASTADLTLAVSSDHDDGLPELLTYDSVVYELKSNQPGVKVSKDGTEEWIPVVKKRRKRTCKRKMSLSLCLFLMTVVMS